MACGKKAILVVTRSIEGTATNIARRRVELRCSLPVGHDGVHRDAEHDERWEEKPGHSATLLRHEDDEKN